MKKVNPFEEIVGAIIGVIVLIAFISVLSGLPGTSEFPFGFFFGVIILFAILAVVIKFWEMIKDFF
jgi:hypothetical protein